MIIVRFILLASLSLLIFLLGMPQVEQSLQEARNAQAFYQAQKIKIGELPPDTVDPWGQTFEIEHTPSHVMVVTSPGTNGASPADGYDADGTFPLPCPIRLTTGR
tara:strand:- start:2225 stop:2539 length:315 start_codon:yes stop_codon:yes gene_type:complete